MPDAALVAVTLHIVTAVAESEASESEQPDPETVNVTAPVPEPPLTVIAIGEPIVPVVVVFEMLKAACEASENVKLFGALRARAYIPFAALVAVTTQTVTPLTKSEAPEIEQPAPVTEKLTNPEPDPPEVVKVIGVPAVPVVVEFEMTSVDCEASKKMKVFVGLLAES
jgi:hypothetical protein